MVNVQKMHNDLERSGENDRRRLEGQLHMLESQTSVDLSYTLLLLPTPINPLFRQDLRTQVSQERDNVRHISLQKDIELKELQVRLDKAVCFVTLSIDRSNILVNRHKSSPRHESLSSAQKPARNTLKNA
jgi:hypothetical protein